MTDTPETITRYLERPSDQSFVEIALEQELLTLRRGIVGKPCLTLQVRPDRRKLYDCAVIAKQALIETGYEVTTKSAPIVEGSNAELVWSGDLLDNAKHREVISACLRWSDRKECNIVRFSNGLIFDGNLDVEWFVDFGLASGLIVDGDVQVGGLFSQDTYSYPDGILINGSIKAKNVIHADSHMNVHGDMHVEQTVYGYYNDGQLTIHGTVFSEVLISYDHAMSAEHYRCFCFYDNDASDDLHWANTDLLDDDGNFDFDRVEHYVKNAQSLLRQGVEYKHKKNR